MTPAQRVWLLRAQRRLAGLEPELRAAYLDALKNVTAQMSEADLSRAISSGDIQRVLDQILADPSLDRALFPMRQRMRQGVERAFQYSAKDIPTNATGPASLAVRFDWLSPQVVTVVRAMESRALDTMKADIRATVRQAVTNGLTSGAAPSTVARTLRQTIGLAPNQAQYVENLRAELESGQYSAARQRMLIDKRYALDNLDTLSAREKAARIDRIVETYRRRWIAQNANVNTQLMARDAYREGQRLAWLQAQANGTVPPGYAMQKTWIHLDPQLHPRPEHQALHGETVPIDQPYSTGQMSAGLGDYGCHCMDRYTIGRAS